MKILKIAVPVLASLVFTSCDFINKIRGKKHEKSDATGWNYNDKDMGGYQVAKSKDQATGPGLVFVEGGTFVMGQTQDDVMGDWNNVPRRVTVGSFLIDKTEVANVHYREYIYWLERIFDPTEPQNKAILNAALPDTLCWRSELSYNEPYVEYYFRHPGFNYYPVVGVSWKQASDFCLWRSDRVNEGVLINKGFIAKQSLQGESGYNNFTTKSYLLDLYQAAPGKAAQSRSNPLKDGAGQPRSKISMEDGILLPDYRLPTEAEWEYAAYGLVNQNPRPSLKEGKRGEELISNKQNFPWAQNHGGVRENRRGSHQGKMLANFKRGSGDNAGVAGGLNDKAIYTSEVKSFYPNGFGLYNMAGNVNEWVQDVYRPMNTLDFDDLPNPFRGNEFTKIYKNAEGEAELNDTTGRVKMAKVTDEESKNRRNYQRGNLKNFIDGDSLSAVTYGYGKTSLISDHSRVFKGGSWNDLAYWLSPSTRRFLEEEQSSSTLGFRCAMDRMGSPEGNRRKTGYDFPARRQRR